MRWLHFVVAGILVLVGVVWIGQGTGNVAGSAMSGQSMWAYIGGALVIAGLAIGAWGLIRRPASRP
jgi:uncharacterized membrane protein YdcZ (DUF606 family)